MAHPIDDDGDGDAGRGTSDDDLTLIAHQGFAGVYPGNTLAAMHRAARDGAAMIEIDVQPCADGDVVVFHDPRLDAATDQQGLVTETDCDTVLGAAVHDSGETISTLDAVMAAIPPNMGVNVELKKPVPAERVGREDGSDERTARWLPLVERTLDVLSRYDNPLLFSSFHVPALAAVRELDSTARLAPLFADAVDRAFIAARRYDAVAIHPSLRCTTREFVVRAHADGLTVNAYTVTHPAQATRLRQLGVDGVIADSASVLDS